MQEPTQPSLDVAIGGIVAPDAGGRASDVHVAHAVAADASEAARTSFDAWRASDGYVAPPDSTSIPQYHLPPESSAVPSTHAPQTTGAIAAPAPHERTTATASAPLVRNPTWAQLALGVGLLVTLLLAIHPTIIGLRNDGAIERVKVTKAYIESELARGAKDRERADEEAIRKYETDLARTQQSEYERRQAVEFERERRRKSRSETAEHQREELAKELDLRALEREAVESRSPPALGGPLLAVLVLALAAVVFGSLSLTLRSQGPGRLAYAVMLLIALSAAGVGVAGATGLPALERAGPTSATARTATRGPSRAPPGGSDDRALCERLFGLIGSRSETAGLKKDEFMDSCKREIGRASASTRACYEKASSLDDLMTCGRDEDRQKKK